MTVHGTAHHLLFLGMAVAAMEALSPACTRKPVSFEHCEHPYAVQKSAAVRARLIESASKVAGGMSRADVVGLLGSPDRTFEYPEWKVSGRGSDFDYVLRQCNQGYFIWGSGTYDEAIVVSLSPQGQVTRVYWQVQGRPPDRASPPVERP